MTRFKQHIVLKIATLLITLTLILPSVVKFSHVFSHHEHEICLGENQTHLHTLDLDCSFYKFKLNHQFTIDFFSYELFSVQENHQVIVSQYEFLSPFQQLHFSLRGPPFNS